jgi:hypothetical protein
MQNVWFELADYYWQMSQGEVCWTSERARDVPEHGEVYEAILEHPGACRANCREPYIDNKSCCLSCARWKEWCEAIAGVCIQKGYENPNRKFGFTKLHPDYVWYACGRFFVVHEEIKEEERDHVSSKGGST